MSRNPQLPLLGTAAALLLPFTFTSCETLPNPFAPTTGEQVDGHVNNAVTQEQAARKFFDAYKHGNRLAASQVATPKAIQQLRWNPLAGAKDDLELQETSEGDWLIFYPGGFMELEIHGDGHVGHTVTNVTSTAD
jgi:hypothetical protein